VPEGLAKSLFLGFDTPTRVPNPSPVHRSVHTDAADVLTGDVPMEGNTFRLLTGVVGGVVKNDWRGGVPSGVAGGV
jgi:hypothetical protein